MRVNRQWSVRKRGNVALIRGRNWRGFGSQPVSGARGVLGVIAELYESNKLLCDFDQPKVKHGRRRLRLGENRRFSNRREFYPSPPLQSLAHTLGLKVIWQRWDKTRHGWHLIVKLRQKLTLAEIICCQTLLGSDKARERMNLAREISLRLHPSRFWERRANILFSRKLK